MSLTGELRIMNSGCHASEDEIENLALGRLATADSIRVQRHLYKCGHCLRRLIRTAVILAQEGLAHEPDPTADRRKPLFLVHDTADGLIYLRTERQGPRWIARLWGGQFQGARKCRTIQEANEHLLATFHEMFAEHYCTERCRAARESAVPLSREAGT